MSGSRVSPTDQGFRSDLIGQSVRTVSRQMMQVNRSIQRKAQSFQAVCFQIISLAVVFPAMGLGKSSGMKQCQQEAEKSSLVARGAWLG